MWSAAARRPGGAPYLPTVDSDTMRARLQDALVFLERAELGARAAPAPKNRSKTRL